MKFDWHMSKDMLEQVITMSILLITHKHDLKTCGGFVSLDSVVVYKIGGVKTNCRGRTLPPIIPF